MEREKTENKFPKFHLIRSRSNTNLTQKILVSNVDGWISENLRTTLEKKRKMHVLNARDFFLIILGRMYFGPIFFGKGKKVQVCSASGIVRLHY